MYHSITFGNKNTYDDWHLVATERPCVAAAAPKLRYIDIPGGNGSIDLTDALAGRASFSNREGSFDFYVLNDYPGYNWVDVYRMVSEYLHGKRMTMTLEDDPNYFYEGRFSVNSWKSQENWSQITIDYNLDPEKYWQGVGVEPKPVKELGSGLAKVAARRAAMISYHSLVFEEIQDDESDDSSISRINTYDDWHLVATERPSIAFPDVKTQYVDTPGLDGQIDLTEALINGPTYSNREGSFEFYVLNDYPGYNWVTVYDKITQYLHGKKMRLILEDDPEYFYKGRFTVNEFKTQKDWSHLTIDYNLEPFKHHIGWVTEPILDQSWDPITNHRLDPILSTAYEPIAYGGKF